MNRLIVLACKLAIAVMVVDLLRRGWRSLELKPYQVSAFGLAALFVIIAWSSFLLLTLYWLLKARAAIARRQAGPVAVETDQPSEPN